MAASNASSDAISVAFGIAGLTAAAGGSAQRLECTVVFDRIDALVANCKRRNARPHVGLARLRHAGQVAWQHLKIGRLSEHRASCDASVGTVDWPWFEASRLVT